jgi:uncharacterized protein (DUF169 family)
MGGLTMKKEFTRREVLGVGLGAAALATAGTTISTASAGQSEKIDSSKLSQLNKFGDEMETSLVLRTSPIAVKMLEKETDIPKEAFRPKRDGGYHIAQCQAFGMSRREGMTVAMLKEDHWCPTALMAYGMVEKPTSMGAWAESYMSFETGKYIGILTAPLKSATFIPDVTLVYLNPAQLRGVLLPIMFGGQPQGVTTHLLLPSCGHAVVDPIKTGNYCVVLPDPGEYQRALAAEEEMILAIPQQKMEGLMTSLKRGGKMYSHREQHMSMHPDFEQPQFYKDMFKGWGLDSE